MSPARAVVAVILALLGTVLVAWMSRVPFEFESEHEALVRLSWRVDGISIEECRQLSAEELANLPIHMRSPEACIGRIAPYRLQVALDGQLMVNDTIRPGGARGDRPIYVLSDFPVDPGEHRIQVRFDPILLPGTTWLAEAAPLSFDETVSLERRDIVLVTVDDDTHQMVARRPQR
jgi:hypothetical protein